MHLSAIVAAALAAAGCAKPIQKIKRQHIEDTYDFVIAGGMLYFVTTGVRLNVV